MARYFIDTEFLEDFHKPLFGKKRHFIDLISIGIVEANCPYDTDGDGNCPRHLKGCPTREYYAISKNFDLKAVWNKYDLKPDIDNGGMKKVYWLRENVLRPIFNEWRYEINGKIVRLGLPLPLNEDKFTFKNFKKVIGYIGKSNKQIATEIMLFVWADVWSEWIGDSDEFFERGKRFGWNTDTPIEFYGYYSAYDHVLLSSLFGRMIDLPKGFPMYMRDLKQMLDEKAEGINQLELTRHLFSNKNWEFTREIPKTFHSIDDYTLPMKIEILKSNPNYPKQENEHSAIQDAKWNKKLYEFLNTI